MAGSEASLMGNSTGERQLHASVVGMVAAVSRRWGAVGNDVSEGLHLSFQYLCCYNDTELRRISAVVKLGDTPVINMGEIYGLGSFSPTQQLAVLDAAAEVGFKVMYDMTSPGIKIQGGGPFDNASKLEWLRSNVTLVRNHSALLGCECMRPQTLSHLFQAESPARCLFLA